MRFTATCGAVAVLGLVTSAMAGFTAGTGPDPFAYGGAGSAFAPAVGGNIVVSNQPLQSYAPDTAADPQIVPGDLTNFLFSLNVTANAALGATTVLTSGTYSLFYDLGSNGTPDIRVSSGTASLFLQQTAPGVFAATGTLNQILGPANPAFRDLAYNNNANFILQGGLYTGTAANVGTLDLVLRQNAVVPEPVSIGSLAAAGLLTLRRRRA